jgi:hypothetical protein
MVEIRLSTVSRFIILFIFVLFLLELRLRWGRIDG